LGIPKKVKKLLTYSPWLPLKIPSQFAKLGAPLASPPMLTLIQLTDIKCQKTCMRHDLISVDFIPTNFRKMPTNLHTKHDLSNCSANNKLFQNKQKNLKFG